MTASLALNTGGGSLKGAFLTCRSFAQCGLGLKPDEAADEKMWAQPDFLLPKYPGP